LCILSRTGAFGIGRRTFLEYNAFKGSNFGDMRSTAADSSSPSEAMLLTTDYVRLRICNATLLTTPSIYPTRPTPVLVVPQLPACYVLRQLSSDRNGIVTKHTYSLYDIFSHFPFLFIITDKFVILHNNVCLP
jgi:hypothetical protein